MVPHPNSDVDAYALRVYAEWDWKWSYAVWVA